MPIIELNIPIATQIVMGIIIGAGLDILFYLYIWYHNRKHRDIPNKAIV